MDTTLAMEKLVLSGKRLYLGAALSGDMKILDRLNRAQKRLDGVCFIWVLRRYTYDGRSFFPVQVLLPEVLSEETSLRRLVDLGYRGVTSLIGAKERCTIIEI